MINRRRLKNYEYNVSKEIWLRDSNIMPANDNAIVEPITNPILKDPRIKKLKKELEKLNIAPKPKYINLKFN